MKPEYSEIKEKIKDIKMTMFTTLTEEGDLHSRPMTSQEMDEEGYLWFFTSDTTSQVHEVEENKKVNLAYANPDEGTYVSIAGSAEVVRDHVKAEELWTPILKAWFPRGLEEPGLVLLKVTLESAEYWDAPAGRMVQFFKIAKAAVTGVPYQSKQSEHGRADFTRH